MARAVLLIGTMIDRKSIRRAIQQGVSLATLATGAVGCADSAPSEPFSDLKPVPSDVELGCFGPEYEGGYWGQCCTSVVCRLPDEGACPEGDNGRSYGSGECTCEQGVRGPFARPEIVDGGVTGEGPCCYLTDTIGCTGRPLRVAQQPLLAAVVQRGDWC